MVPILIALFGPKRGVRLDLEATTVVGRSSGAELQLIDGKVSREHCRLTVAGDEVWVEDLGSQNGTFVNGVPTSGRVRLRRNDELAIGDSLFMLDPDLSVAAARFGEATLVVGEGAAGAAEIASPDHDGAMTALSALASALVQSHSAEAAGAAVVTAVRSALAPDRAFLLLGDGSLQTKLRALHGWQANPDGKGPAGVAVVARDTLALAAGRRRAILAVNDVETRVLAQDRSVAACEVRTVVVAPLCIGGAVRGFVYADKAGRGSLRRDAAGLLEILAAVASLHGLCGTLGRGTVAPTSEPAGASPAWTRVLKLADTAAAVSSTVLITGPTGTGKEEIARAIHGRGPRAAAPLVVVNCGAIPETLAESELFGHERGAFTGAVAAREGSIESADGGTLFLDEIGDLSAAVQVKLLRVLQERIFFRVGSTAPRSVDIRVIAATHRDLEAEVKAGRFREDLFYRLNVLRIRVPPLRERIEDINPIAEVLLARLAKALGRPNPGLDQDARTLLCQAPWPGNARELANVLERVLVLRDPATRGPLNEAEIGPAMAGGDPAGGDPAGGDPAGGENAHPALSLTDKVAALERAEVQTALRTARGVKTRAAKILGISRPTLDKKIADLGIDLWGPRRLRP